MKSEFAPVEGFDYPRLDTLFLALPIAWKGKVAQYAGRLHRNFEGKTEVQVFDYVDIHVPVLERMYQKRVKSYSAIGYKTKLLSNANVAPDLIYDGKSFYHGFCNDLQNAKSEVLIVSARPAGCLWSRTRFACLALSQPAGVKTSCYLDLLLF